MTLVFGSLHLGFIYGLLAMGVYISFRVLNIPDLTTEGSFTLGLAVSAMITLTGHPFLGILIGMIAGAMAGVVTGLLQTKLMIHPVLAGIITMSALHTINLIITGNSPNVSLIGAETLFKQFRTTFPFVDKNTGNLILSFFVVLVSFLVLILFFKTHTGLSIRATGDNEDMVLASSINVQMMKIIALAISNGMVALSGALITQYQGFADINSGMGILVVGLASVILGEAIFGKRKVEIGFLTAIAGSLIYRFIIAIATKSSLFPAFALKLVSAVIVAIALSIPAYQYYREIYELRRDDRTEKNEK